MFHFFFFFVFDKDPFRFALSVKEKLRNEKFIWSHDSRNVPKKREFNFLTS